MIYFETQYLTSVYKALINTIAYRITLKLFYSSSEQARAQIAALIMVSFWGELPKAPDL